jgi:hypothetical protein
MQAIQRGINIVSSVGMYHTYIYSNEMMLLKFYLRTIIIIISLVSQAINYPGPARNSFIFHYYSVTLDRRFSY